MAKDKLTEYDATAANNTVVGDVNLAENSALPSDMNNAVREVMSHLKEFADGTNGINVLTLADDDASASIKFQAPSAVTATVTFTLPDGDGADGQALITNGSGTLAWAYPYGNRNLIINGAMQVAQRGTSSNNINSYGSVDRFNSSKANDDELAGTQAQSTTAPDGFSNSYKIDCTTAESAVAADEYWRVRHHIEAQNLQQLKYGTSGAQSVTLSFYVRSNVTGTYSCALYQEDGDSGSGRIIGSTYTISSADTWEYKTITFAGDTGGTINNDNGEGLSILWALMAGSNYTATDNTSWGTYAAGKLSYGHAVNMASSTSNEWYITGVQLEVGEQATPFEHRSFGDELARCQRYFELIGYALGRAVSTTQAEVNSAFKVDKRAAPTITLKETSSAIAEFLRAAANITSLNSTYNSQTTHCGNRLTSSDTGMNSGELVSVIKPDSLAADAEL